MEVATQVADRAFISVLKELLGPYRENRRGTRTVQSPNHPGVPANRLDAVAEEAARTGLHELSASRGPAHGPNRVHYCGEESAGIGTQNLHSGDFIVRTDPLDGTTNAVTILTGFASVALVDRVEDQNVTHLAGAIVSGHIDVRWYVAERDWYADGVDTPLEGRVFVRAPRLPGDNWAPLPLQRNKRLNTLAAVAASRSRWQMCDRVAQGALADGGRFYNLAGNPYCGSLLIGQLGGVFEPSNVTLHDSAYLIPLLLAGGSVEDLQGMRLDYLSLYETNALDFALDRKPVPPFLAYLGHRPPGTFDAVASEGDHSFEGFKLQEDTPPGALFRYPPTV